MSARDLVRAAVGWSKLAALEAGLWRGRGAAPQGDRHLLLLAYAFPPYVTGGVFRPTSFVRYADRRGWRTTVIAAAAPADPGLAGRQLWDALPTSMRVARLDRHAVAELPTLPGVNGGIGRALATVERARRIAAEDPFRVVVSTGPPFHNHVAGRYVAGLSGVPLVLDYRDEWNECPMPFVEVGRGDRWWERRCLRDAQRVVFTTRPQLEHQLRVFPELARDRCRVIPNGWEVTDERGEGDASALVPRDDLVRLAHVGTLGEHNLPAPFLTDLERALAADPSLQRRLRVLFVGRITPRAAEQLDRFRWPETIERVEEQPQPVAVALMRRVEGLLILNGPSFHRYRPGKLYDYIASGRPVVVHGVGGEVAELVDRFDAGWVVAHGDADRLRHVLGSMDGRRSGPGAELCAWLGRHSREATANAFVDLVEEVTAAGGARSGSP